MNVRLELNAMQCRSNANSMKTAKSNNISNPPAGSGHSGRVRLHRAFRRVQTTARAAGAQRTEPGTEVKVQQHNNPIRACSEVSVSSNSRRSRDVTFGNCNSCIDRGND